MSASNSDPGFTYGEIPSAIQWKAAFSGKVDAADGLFTTPVLLAIYTVATLPAAIPALRGNIAAVTDALTPTYRGTLTGGSTAVCMVICTGSVWLSC